MTPLADWLRAKLGDDHDKKWLIGKLVEHGKKQATALQAVTRWTTPPGQPPTAATLDPEYIRILSLIFDEAPPGAEVAKAWDDEIQGLKTRIDALEQRLQGAPADPPDSAAVRSPKKPK